MFKNYFLIAWRNLVKNKTFSVINIVGLSISVAFCLLLFFYIRNEQSFDTFHSKKNHLFRVEMTNTWPSSKPKTTTSFFSFLTKNNDVENQLTFPLIVGRDMQQTFPEIKSVTRFQDQGEVLITVNNQGYKEKDVIYADDNFFNNFSFPAIKGDIKTALMSPTNVVISESTANKFFGNSDVVGKTIQLIEDTTRVFTVAAVAKDAPVNSSIQYTVIVPLKASVDYADNIKNGFNQSSHILIAELADNVSISQFELKLNKWVKKYYVDAYLAENKKNDKDVDLTKFQWYLRPFEDAHYNISDGWGHYTNSKNIYQLSCLVIIILLIASLNYVLLAISNAASRSQEVGVRKVMGAKKSSIILQFWIQTQIVVTIAVFLGLLLSRLLLPLFNNMLASDLVFSNISWLEIMPALIILCAVLGLIAGYYPALIVSRLKPISILKSFQTLKINPRFSKIMVVVQYTACVVLMVAAFVINKQMIFINNKDLGFDKEQVLMVRNPTWDGSFTKRVHSQLQDFAKTQPYVLQFSGMNGGLNGSYNTNGFKLNGEQKWRKQLTVDYGYFEMLNIKFLQGRPFSRSIASDTSRKMRPLVINETLFKMLGDTAKIGQYCRPLRGVIIGVVQDYHFETLSKKIEPEEHVLATKYEMYFMFKIQAGQMQQGIAKIEKEWKSLTDYPFEYSFLDATITKMYEADVRWQKTIQVSCFFAIFIACLGLFGLSAINAINRTKEIGIRKVLGASVKDIVAILSSSFLIMALIAILIATPIAWWIMNKWLEDFAYRITINWWMFAIVGSLALLIALLAVSFQAIKAAIANPVKSLKIE